MLQTEGVMTTVTGTSATCNAFHLTEFAIQEFSPTAGADMLVNSNLVAINKAPSPDVVKSFVFPLVIGMWLLLVAVLVWGKITDEREAFDENYKGLSIPDTLYLNKMGENPGKKEKVKIEKKVERDPSKSMLALKVQDDSVGPVEEEFKSAKQLHVREDDEETVTSKPVKGKKKKGKKKKGKARPERDEFDEIPNIMEYDHYEKPNQKKRKL